MKARSARARAAEGGGLLALLAGSVLGCGTTHALPHPTRLPAPRAACSIGVASLVDEQGVDFALDLRDYLREHGPCRAVRAVTSAEDDTVDLVVSGRVTSHLTPSRQPAGQRAATAALGVGLGALLGGAVIYGVAGKSPTPDSAGFVDPGERATQKGAITAGTAMMAVGGVITALGIAGFVVDGVVTREVSLSGSVDVDLVITRRGAAAGQLHEHDEVTARGKHDADRPESRQSPAASGPLYREVMARVFEHIAARVGDTIESTGAP